MTSPRKQARRLRAQVPIALAGDDPEGVHQLRVAAARLDTWFRLTGQPRLQRELRNLRRTAATVRDLDVLLQHEGLPEAWRRHLTQRHGVARRRLERTLETAKLAKLLDRLDELKPIPAATLRPGYERIVARVRRAGERLLEKPKKLARVHALRRALRRLRYAREWLALDRGQLKKVQEALGQLNDRAVALEVLNDYRPPKAVRDDCAALAARWEDDLAQAQRTVVSAWGKHGARFLRQVEKG